MSKRPGLEIVGLLYFCRRRHSVQCQLVGKLPGSMATIHPQIASSHKAAGVTDQKHSRATVLLRARQTAQHVLLGPFLAALGVLHKQVLDHLGDDIPGADGVDANVVLAPFGGEVAAELDDGCFGGIIGWADEALDTSVSIK